MTGELVESAEREMGDYIFRLCQWKVEVKCHRVSLVVNAGLDHEKQTDTALVFSYTCK